jgi:SAM-dependent MidA family methyltransferase
MHAPTLPRPEPAALEASRALAERIRREIREHGGWISFARYMELALYAPGLGYYAGGATKLGGAGDFITAPESGSLFARALARQVAELLRPGDALLEFGAGSGALADDLLPELARLGHVPPYLILEPSAELAARQRARLARHAPRVSWLGELPADFRGVMLANEVIDAMPVHLVAWTAAAILERGVSAAHGGFGWVDRPASGELLAAARAIAIELPPSGRYESEINLAAPAWMRALAASLARGALLVIDYGFPAREYYHAQRSMGTLMCHYRHHAHGEPFFQPGLQDITAHVDFSALAHAAADGALRVLGYTNQAQFLVNCGLAELLGEVDAADAARYAPLAAQAQRLVSPAEMGELFKVLAVGRGIEAPLRGFASGDRTHTL